MMVTKNLRRIIITNMVRTKEQIELSMKKLIDETKLTMWGYAQHYHKKMQELEDEYDRV